MKQCSKCGEWKEVEEFREGRRRCKDCLRAEYREYNRKRREDPAYKEYIRKLQQNPTIKRRAWEYRQNPEVKERDIRTYLQRRSSRWIKCIDLAGGICQKCLKLKPYQVMSFHHVDPARKAKNGSKAVEHLDLTELDKCALLCIECHHLFEALCWQARWRKRDGLGYEIEIWWYTFRYLGDRSEAINDERYRPKPNKFDKPAR